MTNFSDFKLAVEALSGGKNTVLLDKFDLPSVVVPIAKMKYADVLAGGSQNVLPAFILGGAEKAYFCMGKYQDALINGVPCSLPMQDPATSVNFDAALAQSRSKGEGWTLQTNAMWAAIALWCFKNGTEPRGNNNWGQDHAYPHEKGVPCAWESDGRAARTVTGSGPVTWNHNHDITGICDLNGNVWEWCCGLRLMDGHIQIIPYNDAALATTDMSRSSTAWKEIMPDGSIVAAGTAGTLCYDSIAAGDATQTDHGIGAMQLNNKVEHPQYTGGSTEAYYGRGDNAFKSLAAKSGVTVPELAMGLGLMPPTGWTGDDYFYCRNYGERLPVRGGSWYNTSYAGVFCLLLGHPRASSNTGIGRRSAFVGTL